MASMRKQLPTYTEKTKPMLTAAEPRGAALHAAEGAEAAVDGEDDARDEAGGVAA